MAKSKITEKHSMTISGILDAETDIVKIDVDDLGTKQLSKLFKSFSGQSVKISISLTSDIEE